jgi:arylsulfatase A-like enzyme
VPVHSESHFAFHLVKTIFYQSFPVSTALLVLLLLHATGSALVAAKPNIIVILADDLGYSDLGCYGHAVHETPHLDRLSREGLRFTQAYSAAPICSASRAALLTGRTPARLHVEFVTKEKPGSQKLGQKLQSPPYPTELSLDETTIAEALTGHRSAFLGKWHLAMHHGGYLGWSLTHGPLQQGFAEGDSDFGAHPYSYPKKGAKPQDMPAGEFPPDSLTDKVLAFIKRKHTQPFYLHWSLYQAHDPIHTRCRWLVDKYRQKMPAGTPLNRLMYAAMVETMDHEVGRVLSALKEAGMEENTLVLFTSDNGGHPQHTGNAPHRGSKWNLYEGGIRVPLIARWPGSVPLGSICAQAVHGCDLLPTLAEVAEVPSPQVDGISLSSLLRDPSMTLPERALTWHFPYYHPETAFEKAPAQIGINGFTTSQTRPHSAIRLGNHKLLHFDEDGRDELYDLATDPGETTDLSKGQPQLVMKLRERLQAELKASSARMVR